MAFRFVYESGVSSVFPSTFFCLPPLSELNYPRPFCSFLSLHIIIITRMVCHGAISLDNVHPGIRRFAGFKEESATFLMSSIIPFFGLEVVLALLAFDRLLAQFFLHRMGSITLPDFGMSGFLRPASYKHGVMVSRSQNQTLCTACARNTSLTSRAKISITKSKITSTTRPNLYLLASITTSLL